jgi:hypothetical protein
MAPRTKIHTYLEIAEEHYTAGVARFSFAANYRVFSLMANVRNAGGITPVSPPKGFPLGISAGAQAHFDAMEQEANDPLHSHTWLSTDEVKSVLTQADGFVPGLVACAAAMEALEAKGSNPRLLVAFED